MASVRQHINWILAIEDSRSCLENIGIDVIVGIYSDFRKKENWGRGNLDSLAINLIGEVHADWPEQRFKVEVKEAVIGGDDRAPLDGIPMVFSKNSRM